MAYEYDQLGNIIGEYESEEERRLREAINQPVKQSITYNPDGTREMTIKGTPEALSPVNPNTPTFTTPQQAAPQPVQQQAPSREQQRTQTLQAEQAKIQQQLQTTQDPAMIDRLRRDYMAVQNEMTRGQGQRVPSVRQTIGNMASSMIPSAQAQPIPQQRPPQQAMPQQAMPQQAMPQPAPAMQPAPQQSMYSLGTGQPSQGMQAPQLGQAPASTQVFDFYQQFQDNPRALISMAYTSEQVGVPDWMRDRMKNRASELITQQRETENAKQQIPTMSENDIAKVLREKTTGGSYLKAALFGILGMENSAMAEAAKLGVGKETMTTVNGQPAIVKMANNGTPIEGYSAVTGKKLSAQELIVAAQSATLMKGANIGGQVYRDPATNETLTKVDTQQGPIYYNKAQQRVVPKGEPVPLTAGSDISTQLQLSQMKRQQNFVQQTATARIQSFNELNNERAMAGMQPLTPQQMGLNPNGELIGQQQPTVPQLQQPPGIAGQGTPQAQTQQAPMPPGPVSPAQVQQQTPAPGLTGAQLKAQREGQQTVMTEAAKQVAASADTQNTLNSINKITALLDSGEHNVGSVLSGFAGRGPIAQAIGGQFETTDAKNTKTILDTVNKLAADGLKALGSNPSTVDLEFWTKYKPDGSSDPVFVKEWIQSRSDDLKRRLGFATSQMGAGGAAGTAPPATAELTAQQKARQELERRKKER
jgi:hypothetical protein